MGKMKHHPRYNVISLRINDEEREALLKFSRMRRTNVSSIMREALLLVASRQEPYQGNAGSSTQAA